MLTLVSCASVHDQCIDPKIVAEYPGGYEQCYQQKSSEKQARVDAWRNLSNQPSQGWPQAQPTQMEQSKQTDYNCVNNCTANGNQRGLCESKCSY